MGCYRLVAARAATILLIVSVALLGFGCTSGRTTSQHEREPSETVIVAHRGGSLLAPENTLASFQNGIDEGADAIELDVHLSKDGQLIVMHDPSLFRTTGKEGYISDYTADEIKALDARSSYSGQLAWDEQRVPTLDEVMQLLSRQIRPVDVQIEIKVDQWGNRYEGIEQAVIAVLHRYGYIERAMIISFDFPTLLEVKELEPNLRLGALVSRAYLQSIGLKGPRVVAQSIADLGVEYVAINYAYLSPTLYSEFRSRGLGIGTWTVNNEKDIRRIAAMGVDFITSDRPDLLRQLLR